MQRDNGPKHQDDFSDRKTAVAIGIGCKKGCSSEAIAALVERAIAAASCAVAPAALFTHEAKKSEAGPRECGKSAWPAARLSRRPSFAASLFTRRHELAKSDGDVRTSIDRGGRRACRRRAVLHFARRAHERWARKLRDRGQEP